MPNRIVRENILSSVAVCSLDWASEVFYRRLMSVVDDYGRTEAHEMLLRSKCYPLQTDKVRVADITRWMAECQKAGLIATYAVDGKKFLEIQKFGQQQRSASKFPPPPASDSKCYQMISNAHLVVSVSEDVSVGAATKPASLAWSSAEGWEGVTDSLLSDWQAAYPACDIPRQLAAMNVWLAANPAKAKKTNWLRFVTNWLSRAQDRGGDVASNPVPREFQPRPQAARAC